MLDHINTQRLFTGPLFVVGMPRSGTKLLRDLLNRHPDIRIPGIETEFLPYLVRNAVSFKDLSDEKNFKDFHKNITQLPYFLYCRDAGQLVSADTWHKACRKFDAAGIFEALIRLEVDALPGSNLIWGDKSPSYLTDLPLIKSVYPTARFIHIIRDARDYCLSIQQAWGKNMLRAAQRWADGVAAARGEGGALGADYIELHYEDLVTETETSLRRLADFVGVTFDPIMLFLDRPTENLGNTRGVVGVVADNHGKYLKAMSKDVLARVESIAGETLVACGYPLAFPDQKYARLAPWEMRAAQLSDAWNLVRYESQKRGLVGAFLFHFRHYLANSR
jgi:hypothetical protein